MDVRTLTAMLSRPQRREPLKSLAAGLGIALICWYFGVDVWHSILLGCAITVIGLACQAGTLALDARELGWRPGSRSHSAGSRNDVASLSASLRVDWWFVGPTADRRLHEIARRRLVLDGLDLGNPEHQAAIERRIGAPAYRVLARRKSRRLTLRMLIHCLDALDATDPTHYPAPARARRRDLRWIPFSLGRAREQR